jgi:hypothetical protein
VKGAENPSLPFPSIELVMKGKSRATLHLHKNTSSENFQLQFLRLQAQTRPSAKCSVRSVQYSHVNGTKEEEALHNAERVEWTPHLNGSSSRASREKTGLCFELRLSTPIYSERARCRSLLNTHHLH